MSVKIVEDRRTGQPGGIALADIYTQWEGRRIVSPLNRTDFMGNKLPVKEARE